MKIINYFSLIAMPIIILLIIGFGFFEKNKVYDVFIEGAKEGVGIVYNLFPTLVGLFVAVSVLRNSGIIDLIINFISQITELFKIPKEIMPLALLRPISGSAAMAIAIDIMNNYGVDSKIGMISSVIMGSTETTLYTIAVYTSCVKIKKTRGILLVALIGDVVGTLVSVLICNFL